MEILEIHSVSKAFGGVRALQDVSITIAEGQITALIGPNGAGKTTLFNVVSGVETLDGGTVLLGGHDVTRLRPYQCARLGILRTFQRSMPFGEMTVLENVIIGGIRISKLGRWGGMWRTARHKDMLEQDRINAEAQLKRVGLYEKREMPAHNIAYGEQRQLEVARALACNPKILLLDEPVAGMSPEESLEMARLITRIAAEGLTIFLIEHNLDVVMNLSHTIFVMNYGQIIAKGNASEVGNNPKVIEAYLGKRGMGRAAN
jgi:ABC-type branched-subunit amino acid transport system ATPase component